MAAARLIRAEMEMPARHIDRAGGGWEPETDQGTVDVLEGMDDLLRFPDIRQRAIGRLLLGLAANRDGAKSSLHPRCEHPRCV